MAKSGSQDTHGLFLKYAEEMQDPKVRLHAFAAAIKMASSPEILATQKDNPGRWMQIRWRTKSLDERKLVIEGLAAVKADWALNHIREMSRSGAKDCQAFAKETLERLEKAGGLSGQ